MKYITLCKHNLGSHDFLWVRKHNNMNDNNSTATKWIAIDDDVADFIIRGFGAPCKDPNENGREIWSTNVGC